MIWLSSPMATYSYFHSFLLSYLSFKLVSVIWFSLGCDGWTVHCNTSWFQSKWRLFNNLMRSIFSKNPCHVNFTLAQYSNSIEMSGSSSLSLQVTLCILVLQVFMFFTLSFLINSQKLWFCSTSALFFVLSGGQESFVTFTPK